MASLAGKQAPPYAGIYAATKAGLIAFSQSLRAEYRNRNISATAICPGFTEGSGIFTGIVADVGREPSTWLGTTDLNTVARAAVRAIRKNQPEVIVNTPPLRIICALAELFPRLGEWLLRKGTGRYFRELAQARCRPVIHPIRADRKAA
jgi:short-subunit dehydrogenase